jgi:hypothetical protein
MKKLMPWLDGLREVEATDFLARRDRIASLMQRASEPSPRAAHFLADAYVESSKLEGDAKSHWSIKEVEQAQHCTG